MNKKYLIVIIVCIVFVAVLFFMGRGNNENEASATIAEIISQSEDITSGTFEMSFKASESVLSPEKHVPTVTIRGTTDGVKTLIGLTLESDGTKVEMDNFILIDENNAYVSVDSLSKLYTNEELKFFDTNLGKLLSVKALQINGETSPYAPLIALFKSTFVPAITALETKQDNSIYSVSVEGQAFNDICTQLATSIETNSAEWVTAFDAALAAGDTNLGDILNYVLHNAAIGINIVNEPEIGENPEEDVNVNVEKDTQEEINYDVSSEKMTNMLIEWLKGMAAKPVEANMQSLTYSISLTTSESNTKTCTKNLSYKNNSVDNNYIFNISYAFNESAMTLNSSQNESTILSDANTKKALNNAKELHALNLTNLFYPDYSEKNIKNNSVSIDGDFVIYKESNDSFDYTVYYATQNEIVFDIYTVITTNNEIIREAYSNYYTARQYAVMDEVDIEHFTTDMTEENKAVFDYVLNSGSSKTYRVVARSDASSVNEILKFATSIEELVDYVKTKNGVK